jgi:predicted Zn-dependent peptidase
MKASKPAFAAVATACTLALGSAAAAPNDTKPAPPKPTVTVALSHVKYVLPNGLEVILHEDHRTPIVAVNVYYHVGSKDEAPRKNGFAHLFEHVMFQGSRNVGEDQFFKYLERAGASDRNGTTNTDRTNYFETVPSNQLELVLWLESDRMGFLLDHANQQTFQSQREVVKNERRQNYENAPYGLVPQFIHEALFPPGHPYRLLTIGSPEDLDAATLDDVKAFFRTFYVPNNATLVVAGDVDPTKARALIEKYFAGLPRGAPRTKPTAVPVQMKAEKRQNVAANVELPRLILTWAAPPALTPDDLTLDVTSEILSVGKSSRLYKRLVYDDQIAQAVDASEWSAELGGTFEVVVTLKKGKTPEQALAAVDAELARLRREPITEAELDRARTHLVSELVFRNEQVTARADSFNYYNHVTGNPGFLGTVLARYQATTEADVKRAVERYLGDSARVVTSVKPDPSAPRAGKLAELKP